MARKRKVSKQELRSIRQSAAGYRTLEPEGMKPLLDLVRQAKDARDLCKSGVYKVDVGYKMKDGVLTDQLALRVHVYEKKEKRELAGDCVKPTWEGFPVDVIKSGTDEEPKDYARVVGGASTGNRDLQVPGTLGAVVFDAATRNGKRTGPRTWREMALTNQHVYVDLLGDEAGGRAVTQPAIQQVGRRISKRAIIGRVARWDDAYDCAVALLETHKPKSTSIVGIPGGIKGVVDPAIGMRVIKSGVGSGLTRGMIEAINEREFTIAPVPGKWEDLSVRGDSGAIWLEEESHAAVGLHCRGEASGDQRSYAKPIREVARRLRIQLNRKSILRWPSRVGPVVASLGGRLLLGWVDQRDGVLRFAVTSDGLDVDRLPARAMSTRSSPSLTTFRDHFVVAWTDADNHVRLARRHRDEARWSDGIDLGAAAPSPPAVAAVGGRLQLAWRGPDDKLVLREVEKWKPGRTYTLEHVSTTAGPALAALGSRLFLAYSGKGDHRLNLLSSDGILAFTREPAVGWTNARPCLHFHDERLYVAWRREADGRLCVRSSPTGKRWSRAIVLRESSLDGPSLASLGSELVWAWSAAAPSGRLSLLQYDTWHPEPEPRKA